MSWQPGEQTTSWGASSTAQSGGRGDYPTVFNIGAASPECCVHFWVPQCKAVKALKCLQRGATKLVMGLEACPVRSSFLRKGSGEGGTKFFSEYPVTGHVGIAQSCTGEVWTGPCEAFLYHECGQTAEQFSREVGRCSKPVSV